MSEIARVSELEGDPCDFQGTVHRSYRYYVEQELTTKQITRTQYVCRARALEAMDASLEEACQQDRGAIPQLFRKLSRDFDRCIAAPASAR